MHGRSVCHQKVPQTNFLNVLTSTCSRPPLTEYTRHRYESKHSSFVSFISLIGRIRQNLWRAFFFWALGQTWSVAFGEHETRSMQVEEFISSSFVLCNECLLLSHHCALIKKNKKKHKNTSIFLLHLSEFSTKHEHHYKNNQIGASVQLFQPSGQVQTLWVP